MSLLHILVFKMKPETSKEETEQFKAMFLDLKNKIPGIQSINWAANTSPSPFAKGWTEGCLMVFGSEEQRDNFLAHPEHMKLSDYRKEYSDDLLIYDLPHPF